LGSKALQRVKHPRAGSRKKVGSSGERNTKTNINRLCTAGTLDKGNKGTYNQGREFDSDGKPVKDINFTDHGRSQNHTNPHEHPYQPTSTGGTRQRGKARPLNDNNN
jgi:hypothetical protein